MIDLKLARVGFHVFYQTRHVSSPEYGVITRIVEDKACAFVDYHDGGPPKLTYVKDLHWPPYYCAMNGGVPAGQPYSSAEELIVAGLKGTGVR
jgi:hypothetical protein